MNRVSAPITAIVFDCFGVLVSEGWLPFKQKYFGDNPDLFEEATAAQKRADAGLIDHQEFVQIVAGLAGISVKDAHWQINDIVTNQELLTYIKDLKTRYKIGFISNASQNWLDEFFTPEQVGLFDQVAISSETGLVKPDSRAYEHIADLLDTPMNQCVLIDDQPLYCKGAEAVGMKAIVYKELPTMKKELEGILQNE